MDEAASLPSFSPDTALLIVDVQNDFADPSGSLYVDGGEQVVPLVNQLASDAIAAGAPVILTQDWHPEETPHFIDDGGVWPRHCVRDTWGASIHPELSVSGPVVRKGTNGEDGYSGFTMRDPVDGTTVSTDLDDMLRKADVKTAVVVGIALDVCVRATAEDALANGYDVTVIEAATRAVNLEAGDGDAAVDAMRAAGIAIV